MDRKKDSETGDYVPVQVVDEAGNTYVVDSEGNVEKVEGDNQDAVADNSIETEDFYAKATALLEEYLEELEPVLQNWLATHGKGPLTQEEMALLAELPDGIIADPDINQHLLNKIIPSIKADKEAFIDRLLAEHFENEQFKKIVSQVSNSNQPTASLSDQEVTTSKRIIYGFLTYESAFDFLDGIFDFVDTECGGQAKEKLKEYWKGNLLFLSEATLAYGYCVTSEQKCAGKDYWTRFGYGVANALIQEVDVVGMLEGVMLLKELIKSSREQCISSLFKITSIQSAEQLNSIISNCSLLGLSPEEIQQIYEKAYEFVQENWDDGYYHGQATVFVVTFIVPTKFTKLSHAKLLSRIKNVKGFRGLIKIDNLADEFKRFVGRKGVDNILAKLDNLDLPNLKGKLNELDDAAKIRFADDVGDLSDDAIRQLEDNFGLLDEWKKIDALEDAAKASRKPDWLKKIEQGNEFNRIRSSSYPYNEVYVKKSGGSGYYRLDSYKPGQEIVSRKYTQFDDINENTAFAYLMELKNKYPDGAEIADVASNISGANKGIMGTGNTIRGQLILEVPVQKSGTVAQSIIDKADDFGILIRDVTGKIY